MFLIQCPYCGARDESEFHYGGDAHRKRPENPESLSDEQWADYLFMRKNIKGPLQEQWVHAAGCRKWFNVVRDSVTYQITEVYKMGEKPEKSPEQLSQKAPAEINWANTMNEPHSGKADAIANKEGEA